MIVMNNALTATVYLFSALGKLKESNAAKLELETRKMEERIRSLKEKMTKEKEERE